MTPQFMFTVTSVLTLIGYILNEMVDRYKLPVRLRRTSMLLIHETQIKQTFITQAECTPLHGVFDYYNKNGQILTCSLHFLASFRGPFHERFTMHLTP